MPESFPCPKTDARHSHGKSLLNDKSLVINGGTGSFGKRYTRTVLARYRPKKLIVYSGDELKQFERAQELNTDCLQPALHQI